MSKHVSVLLAITLSAICVTVSSVAAVMPAESEFTNSIGMKFVRIEPGSFKMGFEGKALPDPIVGEKKDDGSYDVKEFLQMGNPDEQPSHKVTITRPFYMGIYEVTNAQYEKFNPEHKVQRGKRGHSLEDNDAVIQVTWHEADAFCKWLSEKEGLEYRLPTEAEWEYACRADTKTPFNTGDLLTEQDKPNAWGLYYMHGNAEEWCSDWYGPYEAVSQVDPVGRIDGDYKVIRGGSYESKDFYLRSANRSGSVPDDKSYRIGLRVVLGPKPNTAPLGVHIENYQKNVPQAVPADIAKGPEPDKPYFNIRTYVKIPKDSLGPLHYYHNHNPDIAQCPNGDLFAIFFSTQGEGDREMVYGGGRLRFGNDQWDDSDVVWGPPDRKAEYSVLWVDQGTIYNFSSLGSHNSRPSAIIMRTSDDNAVTWSKGRVIAERNEEQGVMENVFRMKNGAIVIPMDDHNIYVSKDNAKTWYSPCDPSIEGRGPAGIHTPMMEISGNRIMALGRYGDIDGHMPISISEDMGKTWKFTRSPFTGIGGGKRATLKRLKEGPIFFASFAKDMEMTDGLGNKSICNGLFAAISYDEGKTWPVMQLISDGSGRKVFTRKNKYYDMTPTKSEGNGYLASCQSADGVIHVVSNRSEYAFNLKWVLRYSQK